MELFQNKKLAILGFSFKANTNDTRESPSKEISKKLLEEGAILSFYDPKVSKDQILLDLGSSPNSYEKLLVCEDVFKAAEGADAVLILTEWDEFKQIDWHKIYHIMRRPAWVFDTRICTDKDYLSNIGFKTWSLGS